MSDERAKEIAAGLTKAQRNWFLFENIEQNWLSAEGLEDTPMMEKCGYERRFGGHNLYRPTPLGLAVREVLLAEQSATGEGR